MNRLPHLDGLRGIAAIVVVFAHAIQAFYPAMVFRAEGRPIPLWQQILATSPLFVTINGGFAVSIFFVLSGYVISSATDCSKAGIVQNCVARLIRPSVPCAASILLAGVLLSVGANWTKQVMEIVGHPWFAQFVGDPPWTVVLAEASGLYYRFNSQLNR